MGRRAKGVDGPREGRSGGLDAEVVELLAAMEQEGLYPAMIVFLGDAGEPRVATRGVDPLRLLQDLARRSVAARPCRRGVLRH